MSSVTLPAIPHELSWASLPLDWNIGTDQSLTIVAEKSTDLFVDPIEKNPQTDIPKLLFRGDSEFTLSAKVEVDLQSTYDAGLLIVYIDDTKWAKFCLELSPQNHPTIVSVVNRDVSDDCNSAILTKSTVYLRVSKKAHSYAFHYSEDKQYWHLVRYFTLGNEDNSTIGFCSQSPMGNQCKTVFTEISYSPEAVEDIRSGQ